MQAPCCHNPQRNAENHQHCPGVGRHQCFPHKPGVEVYLKSTTGCMTLRVLTAEANLARLFRMASERLSLYNTEMKDKKTYSQFGIPEEGGGRGHFHHS